MPPDREELFSAILDIGESMLVSGGEVCRVEDSIIRLVRAYGGEYAHVYCIPSHIVVTAAFDGREITHTRRVMATYTNLESLSRINDLARRLCREKPPAGDIRELLVSATNPPTYGFVARILIYALISFCFAVFFGGSLTDAAVSAFIGVVLFFATLLSKRVGGNALFTDILCAGVSAFLAVMAQKTGIAGDADKVIIGNIMLLIPGVELVNGMRDFIAGDIQTGIIHVTEAVILAVGIAVGAAGVLTLMGG